MRRVGRRESGEVSSRDAWTRKELATLLEVARAHEPRLYPALLLAFSTGLRRGEVLGLQWADVVVKRAELCVRRSVSRGVAATPKSGRARTVAMPPSLVREIESLLALRHRQQIERGWASVPLWVFCSESGDRWDENNFSRAWRRVQRRAQKQGVRPLPFHSTRHSYATFAIDAGRSIRWVSEQLGHADPAMTLRAYAHVLPRREEDVSFADFGAMNTAPDGPIRPLPSVVAGSEELRPPKAQHARQFPWSGRSDSNRRPSAPKVRAAT